MAAMPPNEPSSRSDARNSAGGRSGRHSFVQEPPFVQEPHGQEPHVRDAMARSALNKARNVRVQEHVSEWDDASGWHAEDEAAASNRARLLLKRRSGSMLH